MYLHHTGIMDDSVSNKKIIKKVISKKFYLNIKKQEAQRACIAHLSFNEKHTST